MEPLAECLFGGALEAGLPLEWLIEGALKTRPPLDWLIERA